MVLGKLIDSCCADGLPFMKKEEEVETTQPVKTSSQPTKKPAKKTEEEPVAQPEPETQPEPEQRTEAPESSGKFSAKDTKYGEYGFDDLPSEAKAAAEVLGFDKEKWDDDGWAETDDYSWEDLSAEQQSAATTLGWDQAAWDDKYEETDWDDLPSVVQEAATSLGWTKQLWDDDEEWPESCDEWWSELTPEARSALMVMGYSKADWE